MEIVVLWIVFANILYRNSSSIFAKFGIIILVFIVCLLRFYTHPPQPNHSVDLSIVSLFVNFPFDWLSLGLTLTLLSIWTKIGENTERWRNWAAPLVLGIVDILLAGILLVLLSLTLTSVLTGIELWNGSGSFVTDTLSILASDGDKSEVYWVYIIVSTTFLWSFLHILVVIFSMRATRTPALYAVLSQLRQGDVTENTTVRRYARLLLVNEGLGILFGVLIFAVPFAITWVYLPTLGGWIIELCILLDNSLRGI